MSRAVVTWRGFGRPVAFSKCVEARPSARPRCSHPSREGGFRAGQRLRHDDRHVVRGAHADRENRVADADRLAGLEIELRGRLARRGGGDGELVAHRKFSGLDRLEEEIKRHQLGERRRMAALVGILGVEDSSAFGVDDHAGIARIGDGARLGGGEGRDGDLARRRARGLAGGEEEGEEKKEAGGQNGTCEERLKASYADHRRFSAKRWHIKDFCSINRFFDEAGDFLSAVAGCDMGTAEPHLFPHLGQGEFGDSVGG